MMNQVTDTLVAFLVGFAVLTLTPGLVSAQEDNEEAVARRHFERGVSLSQNGDHHGARQAFEQSYELFPHPGTLMNLAIECDESDDPVEAYRRWNELTERFGSVISSSTRRRANLRLRALREQLAAVSISTNVLGATIFVDGQELGTTPFDGPVHLEPGEHQIRATLDGYQDAIETVDLTEGPLNSEIEFEMTQSATETGDDGSQENQADENTTVDPSINSTPPRSISAFARYFTLGAGLALAVAGGVTFGIGASHHNQVDEGGITQTEAIDLTNSGNSLQLSGYVLWGVGGAMLVSSIVLIAIHAKWQRAGQRAERFLVGFLPHRDGGILSFQGRF